VPNVLAACAWIVIAVLGLVLPRAESAAAGDDREVVAFISGHGELEIAGQLSRVAEHLQRRHEVRSVTLSDDASVDDVDAVVIAGAPDIPDAELYALDQYLMRGGRIAFLLDGAAIPEVGTQSNISPGNIFGFLSTYGVVVNPDLVLDSSCAEGATWGDVVATGPYPFWPVALVSGAPATHPAIAGRTEVPMAWTSSISIRNTGASTTASVLLNSSAESWTVPAFADLGPEHAFELPTWTDGEYRLAGERGFPLAVAVEGDFQSAFAGKPVIMGQGRDAEFVDPEGKIESGAYARMIVFGSSMLFRDDLAEQLPGGAELLEGAIDWLTSDLPPSASNTEDRASREWTPRRTAAVLLMLLCAGAACASVIVGAARRKKRTSRT
jgi:ABC-2 type transport system permease protein